MLAILAATPVPPRWTSVAGNPGGGGGASAWLRAPAQSGSACSLIVLGLGPSSCFHLLLQRWQGLGSIGLWVYNGTSQRVPENSDAEIAKALH